MAIPKNSNFIVVPINGTHSNFFVQNDGKNCYVYAFAGEPIPVIVYHFEKQITDMPNFEILSDAFDDIGNRFLILKRIYPTFIWPKQKTICINGGERINGDECSKCSLLWGRACNTI